MIRLEGISKSYRTANGPHTVFRDLNLEIPTGAGVAFLGRNGAGKTTLINIIGGAEVADTGTISTTGRISWPVGLSGGFQPSMTARDNIKFVARLYAEKEQIPAILNYVFDFADIGDYFNMPVRTFSSGMRSRIAFGLSMAFDFDYYLIDEVTAVGDDHFRSRCNEALLQKKANGAGFIVVSHQMDIVRKFCQMAVVLTASGYQTYTDIEEAIKAYQTHG